VDIPGPFHRPAFVRFKPSQSLDLPELNEVEQNLTAGDSRKVGSRSPIRNLPMTEYAVCQL
jgi:hypothetical protein